MSALQKYSKSSIIEESKARQVCGMKDQKTLTDVEYGNRKKTTKREKFLNKDEGSRRSGCRNGVYSHNRRYGCQCP